MKSIGDILTKNEYNKLEDLIEIKGFWSSDSLSNRSSLNHGFKKIREKICSIKSKIEKNKEDIKFLDAIDKKLQNTH